MPETTAQSTSDVGIKSLTWQSIDLDDRHASSDLTALSGGEE